MEQRLLRLLTAKTNPIRLNREIQFKMLALLIDAIETDPSLGITVLANYGNDLDEVYVTARNPGIEFTATVSTDSSDAYIDAEVIRENFRKQLGN